MSKLLLKYMELKKENSNVVYLFKAGIFYIALDEDAIKLSKNLKLNLAKLNETVPKVGFPVSRLYHYIQLLQVLNIPFKMVDNTYGIIDNYSDYLNNEKLNSIVNNILSLNFNNITFKESFEILMGIQMDLKKIYSEEEAK